MVIKLSIEDDPDAPIFVGHRLGAALQVHDAKSPVAERRRSASEELISAPIRPAVGMSLGETFDESSDVASAIVRQNSGDAAHQARAKGVRLTARVDKETASVMESCRGATHALPSGESKLAVSVLRTTSGPGAGPSHLQGMVTVAIASRFRSPSSSLMNTRRSSTNEPYQRRVCWPPINSPSSCQECSSVLTALQIRPRQPG